ncbi:MAG: hypothetical protein JKY37_06225 [Nannocystaceae bacterium]|nr:hypothetical protein [Nannocystaceae bacterium]
MSPPPTVDRAQRRRGRVSPARTVEVTHLAHNTLPTSALRTEFGRLLETIMTVPGVLGVVLADDAGYAIDYVTHDRRLSTIDVQLVGAQLGQPLKLLADSADRHGLHAPIVVLEGEAHRLMATTVADEYIMAAMMAGEVNLALAMRRFDAARTRLRTMLEG